VQTTKFTRFERMLKIFTIIAIVIVVLNWITFISLYLINDGDAVTGYKSGEKYYIAKRYFQHGGYTYHETDQTTWLMSRYIGYGLPFTTVIALALFYLI